MLRLESEGITVEVERRGARVASLVARASGRELLFRAPWAVTQPAAPPVDEGSWTCAWAGGWDFLFPNAGAACVVGGRARGFHGEASLGVWEVEERFEQSVVLRWRDVDGLAVRRTVWVDGARLCVDTRVVNEGNDTQPFVLAEHLIFGDAIADGTHIAVERARVTPLADAGYPVGDASAWPRVRRDGRDEDWAHAGAERFSRFGVLEGVAGPAVRAEGRGGHAVEVSWRNVPHLWLWHEHAASEGFPEGAEIVCLGLEPALTPHSLGLAVARDAGEAIELAPGAAWEAMTSIAVVATPY